MNASARRAQFAAKTSLAATVVVVAVKLVAAYLSGSVGVLSEALQSIVDIAMSAVAVAAVGYAAKPPDREHPYGHGKAELLAGAIQMLVIIATSGYILFRAWQRLREPEPIQWNIGALAMAYTLASNYIVAAFVGRVAKDTSSASLESEALHLRGDSIMSAGILAGMLLVGLTGSPWIDPAAAAASAVVGIWMAGNQLAKLVHPLMDGSLPEPQITELEAILNDHPEVRGYHNLRARSVGSQRFVDLHVLLDDDLTFVRAHELAELIEDELRVPLKGAIVNIHYEPSEAERVHRQTFHPND